MLCSVRTSDCSQSHTVKRCWRSSVSPLGLLVFLSFGPISPGAAETAPQADPQQLGPVDVSAPPPRRPQRQGTPSPQPEPVARPAQVRTPARARAPAPSAVSAPTSSAGGQGVDGTTPLNTG